MTTDDSAIVDFYPEDFYVDLRGKGVAWMGEIILPMIDQDRLMAATEPLKSTLTPREEFRNRHGDIIIFTNSKKNANMVSGDLEQKTLSDYVFDKNLNQDAELNQTVLTFKYEQPVQTKHRCYILPGAMMPDPELEYMVIILLVKSIGV
jgi:5'-3' exonuclease